jgi:hypothetical protein
MTETIKPMDYKEAWEKVQADYLITTGVVYNYVKGSYGEDSLLEFLESDVSRYKEYFKGFVATLASILEKLAPGKAFEKKIKEVAHEFQWFLGIGNVKLLELNTEKAVVELGYCPYEKAISAAPKGFGLDRNFFCKYQCNVFMKGFCREVLGFEISFEPQKKGCIYRASRT